MYTLTGLPGVSGKDLEAPLFRSVPAAMTGIKTHRAVTSAGTHGAISVWIDDDGKYRCEFYVRLITQNSIVVSTKREVRTWLKEWFPKLGLV